MPRRTERKPIEIREGAVFVELGPRTRQIIQTNEYNGVPQIHLAVQSLNYGRLPGFEDVADDEATVEMGGIRHGANITPEIYDALVAFGNPNNLAVAAPAKKKRGEKATA